MKKNDCISLSAFRALEMQELDRQRISMEIHDTTVQNLTTLVHKTEYVSKLIDIDIIKAKLEISTMNQIIRDSIDELREIIYDLRPMSIDDLGLVATVERYIDQMKYENDTLKYFLNVTNEENKKVLSVINLSVFRMIQEALTNVRKHAHATKVIIHIIYEPNDIKLEIVDNGVGFQIERISDKVKNFGLAIMSDNVKLLSGTMKIKSKINEGTTIEVEIPIVEEEEYDTN